MKAGEGGEMLGKLARGLAGVFGGAGAEKAPAAPDPDDLPPPEAMTDDAVEAWVLKNFDLTDWVYFDRAPFGVVLASRVEPSARFHVKLRFEDFRGAVGRSGVIHRSSVADYEIDFEGDRHRVRKVEHFKLNGLKSLVESHDGDDEWAALFAGPQTGFIWYLSWLCKPLGGLPREGPVSRLSADRRAWTESTVEPGQDVFAYWDEVSAVYVRPESVVREPKRTRMTIRTELYWPFDETRSQEMSIELDPARRRMRQLEVRQFQFHNLRGPSLPPQRLDRWIETGGSFGPEHFDRLMEITLTQAG